MSAPSRAIPTLAAEDARGTGLKPRPLADIDHSVLLSLIKQILVTHKNRPELY